MDRVVKWMGIGMLLLMYIFIGIELFEKKEIPPWEPEKDKYYQYLQSISKDNSHWEEQSLKNHNYRMVVTRKPSCSVLPPE